MIVAGGFQFQTRSRHAEAVRSLTEAKDAGPPSFTRLEMLVFSLQPITRTELSRFAGRYASRDVHRSHAIRYRGSGKSQLTHKQGEASR